MLCIRSKAVVVRIVCIGVERVDPPNISWSAAVASLFPVAAAVGVVNVTVSASFRCQPDHQHEQQDHHHSCDYWHRHAFTVTSR